MDALSLFLMPQTFGTNVGKSVEILSQNCIGKAPQLRGYGCKPLQSGSYFNLLHMYGAEADRHMGTSPSICYHHILWQRFW